MNSKYVISIILLLVAFWKMIELPNLWKEQAVLCLECHGFCRFSSSGVFLRVLQILSSFQWVMFSWRKWRNDNSDYMQFSQAQNHSDELFLHLNERWKLWKVIQGFSNYLRDSLRQIPPYYLLNYRLWILIPDFLNQDLQRRVPCISFLVLGNKSPQQSCSKQNTFIILYHLRVPVGQE